MQHRLRYIKDAAIVYWLKEDELAKLAMRSEMVSYQRNTTIFFAYEQGNKIYLIKKGRVKLTRTSAAGREVILDILGPGEIFGELSMADEDIRSHSAVAVDNIRVFIIHRSDFEKLLKDHPETALRVLKLACLRRRELEMRLEDLIFQPLANRLALALLWQARRHGIWESDNCVSMHLTQSDLAHLIGASRESVTGHLAKFKRAGLLQTSYRAIQLIDFTGLMQTLSTDGDFEPLELVSVGSMPCPCRAEAG